MARYQYLTKLLNCQTVKIHNYLLVLFLCYCGNLLWNEIFILNEIPLPNT